MHCSITGRRCWFMLLLPFSAAAASTSVRPVRHANSAQRVLRTPAFVTLPRSSRLRNRVDRRRVLSFQQINYATTAFPTNETMSTDPKIADTSNSAGIQHTVRARIVSSSDASLRECGSRLRGGELVAFPTETVYGLGCHALDPIAVSKVFAAKERPLTDPLIVHVTVSSEANDLWEATAQSMQQLHTGIEARVLTILRDSFWPGPLTLVAKAAPRVPSILMADTGFVACRAPSHPLARLLIQHAQVPIAAPSANKFGHVSPTRADHVYDDLKYEDVWIVEAEGDHHESVVCQVGVESTVAKVEFPACDSCNGNDDGVDSVQGTITVLRQGAISVEDLKGCLQKAGLNDTCRVVSSTHAATTEEESTVAPGQLIRHYSPNVPSYMLSENRYRTKSLSDKDRATLSTTVVIDFGGRLGGWEGTTLAYRDLSLSGDSTEAAQSVFQALRWAEQIDGATLILFPELVVSDKKPDALTLALKDRLTRAASGVLIERLDDIMHR